MSNMEKDNIVKIELEENDMDMIAGGAYNPVKEIKYTCEYCGTTKIYKGQYDLKMHVRTCPKNPNRIC